jgi:hypothetical protein
MSVLSEIHQMVVPLLGNIDLCNYGLASKALADIAGEELFRAVKFHASRESVDGLQSIAEDATLRTRVKHLIWDTNRWDLFPTRQGRELRNFNKLLGRTESFNESDSNYLALRDIHHARYSGRIREERELLNAPGDLCRSTLRETLAKFPKLEKISVLNGHICCEDRKAFKQDLRCGPPLPGEIYSRGYRLHAAREDYIGPAVHEFWNTISVAPKELSKIRVDAVFWRAFLSSDLGYSEGTRHIREMTSSYTTKIYCANLTSLHLTITTINDGQHNYFFHPQKVQWFFKTLWRFVHGLTKLQSLHLSLERLIDLQNMERPLLFRPEGIASERIWPGLRKLSLAYLDMKREDLAKLLVSHPETLKDLRLKNVRLSQNPNSDTSSKSEGPWIGILNEIRDVLHSNSARLKGCLYESGPEWNPTESFLWRMRRTVWERL